MYLLTEFVLAYSSVSHFCALEEAFFQQYEQKVKNLMWLVQYTGNLSTN